MHQTYEKGLKIEIDGAPYEITDFQFVKPGKGQALYRCKMKNLITGATQDKTYRSVEKIGKPNMMQRDMIYSYPDGENFVSFGPGYVRSAHHRGQCAG